MIRAFLVDDEEHALNLLRLFLERTGEVEVVGSASNGFDAMERLHAANPDVAFLDIEMPGMNGLELAERMGSENLRAQIVFVTAYDQYAISAFDRDAVDYLLKPLETERLAKTIQRLKRDTRRPEESAAVSAKPAAAGHAPNVRLMGEIAVEGVGQERLRWRTGKEKELFAMLALRGQERLPRDLIVDALWPDEHYQKAKVYLHTCVSFLRKDLRQLGYEDALKYEGEAYYLTPGLLKTDYDCLTGAIRAAKSSAEPETGELERALSLYQAPLFRAEDYVWAEEDNRKLEQAVSELRLELAKRCERNADWNRLIAVAQEQLAASPYDEEAYRLLMKGYSAIGKHDEVARVYLQLTEKLGELGIGPSEVTRRLYGDIKGD
ncbi:response regulator [Cohnella zeiphila]|uniref:Response regulator n=1 Tax=Cohnella zeiphila TaxID=2761120 RepID=A0A7X0VX52_9BACL|nr:response regulator [Cohnella zeiphila]MBB6733102.1 response regulator [Cohnella zeiphila]